MNSGPNRLPVHPLFRQTAYPKSTPDPDNSAPRLNPTPPRPKSQPFMIVNPTENVNPTPRLMPQGSPRQTNPTDSRDSAPRLTSDIRDQSDKIQRNSLPPTAPSTGHTLPSHHTPPPEILMPLCRLQRALALCKQPVSEDQLYEQKQTPMKDCDYSS